MAYGLKYVAEFRSAIEKTLWKVNLYQLNYTGASSAMLCAGNPLNIVWEKRDDEFYEPIKAATATLKVCAVTSSQYSEIQTCGVHEFKMAVYRAGSLYWQGWVIPSYSLSLRRPPYEVTIKASEHFEYLQSLKFEKYRTDGIRTLASLFATAFDCLGLATTIVDNIGLHPWSNGAPTTTPTLSATQLNQNDIDEVFPDATLYDIIDKSLRSLGAQMYQQGGSYIIRRVVDIVDQTSGVFELWNGNNIGAEATMDIHAPVSEINIETEVAEVESIAKRIGMFDKSKSGFTAKRNKQLLIIEYPRHYNIAEANWRLKAGFATTVHGATCPMSVSTSFRETKSTNSPWSGYQWSNVSIELRVKLAGTTTYKWWNGTEWKTTETFITLTAPEEYQDKNETELGGVDWQLPSIPAGELQVYVKTAEPYVTLYISDIIIEPTGIEQVPSTKYPLPYVGEAMTIDMPVVDVPRIDSAYLYFNIAFLVNGLPTSVWSSDKYVSTLVGHMAYVVNRLHSVERRKITGDMVRMANVPRIGSVYDDDYTRARYMTNYLSVDAYNDVCAVQLCEVASLDVEHPASGDDCIEILDEDLGEFGEYDNYELFRLENIICFVSDIGYMLVYPESRKVLQIRWEDTIIEGAYVVAKQSPQYACVITYMVDQYEVGIYRVYTIDRLGVIKLRGMINKEIYDARYSDELGLCMWYADSDAPTTKAVLSIEAPDYLASIERSTTPTLLMPENQLLIAMCGTNYFYDARVADELRTINYPGGLYQLPAMASMNLFATSIANNRHAVMLRLGLDLSNSANLMPTAMNELSAYLTDIANDMAVTCPAGSVRKYALDGTYTSIINAAAPAGTKSAFIINDDIYIVDIHYAESVYFSVYKYVGLYQA